MKHPFDVLRMKERQLLKVRVEVEALRIAVQLLSDAPAQPTQKQDVPPLDFAALEAALDSLSQVGANLVA
jgi:hypothetical protein